MWNVLEHLHDPIGTLREIYRMQAPGGYLALGVPNITSSQFKRFGADWWVLQLPQHLLFFTPMTLRSALKQAGFSVLRLQLRWVTCSHLPLVREIQRPTAKANHPHWLIALERLINLMRHGDVIKAIASKSIGGY